MKAYCLLRADPWYRRQAFKAGLQRAGFEVIVQPPDRGRAGDVMLIWNRYGGNHEVASRFEREGGLVMVAENGYLGKGGTSPKFDVHPVGPKPEHFYALSIGWHNGRGRWPTPSSERFPLLGIELAPWRTEGDHILICPNRSFGVGEQVMHPDWAQRVAERLSKATKRPVRVRGHPGNNAPKKSIREDLQGAWAAVIWSSSSGAHALHMGIPVYVEAPFWVMKGAGSSGPIEEPTLPDRQPFFEQLAWQQWTCEEIESGEPFRYLLSAAGQSQIPPAA